MSETQNNIQTIDPTVIDGFIQQHGHTREALIPILRAIQDRYHYLPKPALHRICETTEITPAAIAGVSTFYTQFRHRPAGRHGIRVCMGTACHVKNAKAVADAIRLHLDIPEGEDTDKNQDFTVSEVACVGCCMLAPVVKVDDMTYGKLTPQNVPHVLRDFLKSRDLAKPKGTVRRALSGTGKGEIRTCLCSSCEAAGAKDVFEEAQRMIHDLHIPAQVKVVGCTGQSFQAPLVEIVTNGDTFRYGSVQAPDMRTILLEHFRPQSPQKKIASRLSDWLEKMLTDEAWEPMLRYGANPRDNINAYTAEQVNIATELSGSLDPMNLEEFKKSGGFTALQTCVTQLAPEEVIEQIHKSGLRGRGGAGFPTGFKWRSVRQQPTDIKYVICNGDEGDPGAFMDRMLLECFPFRVIEGLSIAAYAVGASQGFFYIRAEYPLAAKRIRNALQVCEKEGLVGDKVFGTDFSIHFKVVEGAGAFVCGEETALIAAIEGRRGMPSYRPPYPAQSGLHGQPTLINNVETLSMVPWIMRNGADAFGQIGTDTSKGTKTFALAGNVKRGGLVEVPMGMTLRHIVEKIGGGVPEGRTLKAVQIGGPSGGCIPEWKMDTPVDYKEIVQTGAIMGSGGLVILDDTDCMVDVARYFLTFTQAESCGKCTHCRVGTKRMLEILERLCEGKAEPDALEKLERLCTTIPTGSLCGLGKTAANPVATTLKYFRKEYEAHMEGRCPALKCRALITYSIDTKCIGCTICAQQCPTDAIPLTPYARHHIDSDACIRCNICKEVCPADAVYIH